jgi:uncharacterized protein (DUF362 family)
MAKRISRRDFLKSGTGFGAAAILGGGLVADRAAATPAAGGPIVAMAGGGAPLDCARTAVDILGGMGRFVPRGSRVVLLPNTQSRHPGTFTHPDIVRAVVRMCREAGAKEVRAFSWLSAKFWQATGLDRVLEEEGALLRISGMEDASFREVPLPRGRALKSAFLPKDLDESDILIDLPIIKNHAGNKFTGTMKNLMGLNAPSSNRTFHKDNWDTDRTALEHLDQCIADLNLAVTPALCVVDAVEIITTNGPFGPGKLARPGKVVAGTDRVAVDSTCTSFLSLRPEDVIMIERGYRHGLGEMDLSRIKIVERTA